MKLHIIGYFALIALAGASTLNDLNIGTKLDSLSSLSANFIQHLKLYSHGRSTKPLLQAQANDYFDKLFESMGIFMEENGYDPMMLPDFEKKFTWFLLSGELSFKKGWLNDIHTIHRHGNVTVDYENKIFNIKVGIEFTTLLFNYNYKAKIAGLGPSGGVDGRMENIINELNFKIDMNNIKIIMDKFDIVDSGKLSLVWTGNGLADWIANIFTNVTINVFHFTVLEILENFLKDFIVIILEKINEDLQNIIG